MTGGTTPGGEMKYSAQELVVDRVVGLRGVCVAEAVQEAVELGQLIRRHLQPDEHATDVCAVVAVVEERDVPARTEAVEELGERAGPEYVYMCVLRWPTLPVRVEK